VKITKRQLRKIIKESMPRMSGMMDPEDPSVMADIEARKSMTDDDVWMENNRDNIDFAIMLIDEQEYERQEVEDIIAHERGNETLSDADIEKIYYTALMELGA
jgi:long-subunit acyl-CoA synthetase (AMP-forming)|tara:strand:+ start:1235 stop:1543 length:309 start_codon:yes stop_codon:yes gene_type:complete